MSVVRTDDWLVKYWDEPQLLSEKLLPYFNQQDMSASVIYQYLILHGMYEHPLRNGEEIIKSLIRKNVWKKVNEEFSRLQKLWDGPNIPIFIFPANVNHVALRKEFNGKSGVAFKDKLFLFISEMNSFEDIKALLIHEYNHVCRLMNYPSKEEDYTLLDTIILEGLAENAVEEQLGKEFLAKWTLYYSEPKLKHMWQKIILPRSQLTKKHQNFEDLLYGKGYYPKMLGYCVGYYLVKKYKEKHQYSSKKLLHVPSEDMIPSF